MGVLRRLFRWLMFKKPRSAKIAKQRLLELSREWKQAHRITARNANPSIKRSHTALPALDVNVLQELQQDGFTAQKKNKNNFQFERSSFDFMDDVSSEFSALNEEREKTKQKFIQTISRKQQQRKKARFHSLEDIAAFRDERESAPIVEVEEKEYSSHPPQDYPKPTSIEQLSLEQEVAQVSAPSNTNNN